MRKLWYFLFYGVCAFTIAFSLYWMAAVPPRTGRQGPASSGDAASGRHPSPRARGAAPGVEERAAG